MKENIIYGSLGITSTTNVIAICTTLYNYNNLSYTIIKDAERCFFADGPQ